MAYQDLRKITYDYCYQYVCKEEPKWPQGATFTHETKTAVDEACLPLQQLITTQVALKELSASPSAFLPCIYYRHMKQSIKSTMLMMLEDHPCLGFFLYYQIYRCTGDLSISAQILYLPLLKNVYHGDIMINYECSTEFLIPKNWESTGKTLSSDCLHVQYSVTSFCLFK